MSKEIHSMGVKIKTDKCSICGYVENGNGPCAHLFLKKSPYEALYEELCKKHLYGDIIEFKHRKETFVDTVNEIVIYKDGRLGLWTKLFPEYPSIGIPEIPSENVIRVVEKGKGKWNLTGGFDFKYSAGDKIKFEEEDGSITGDEVTGVYIIICTHMPPGLRVETKSGYIVEEDEIYKKENT